MAKNKFPVSGIVYSTDPKFKGFETAPQPGASLAPAEQILKVKLETKRRAGKAVTLVDNFSGSDTEKEELGKKLKTFCGTGGSVKDGLIIIQGDNRDKILQWLLKNGYKNTKKA